MVGEAGVEPAWADGPGDFKSPASPPQAFDNARVTDSAEPFSAHLQRAENRPQNTPEMPPDLAEVVAAWHHLPKAVEVGILATVRAAADR